MQEAENTVKRGTAQGSAVGAGLHSLLRRGEAPTARTRPGRGPLGPWPDLRAAAPAADPGFSGPAFPPLVGIARVFRTGVSVVLLKVALLESSFLSGVEVGARAERFIACSLDCLLAFSTTNQPPKKHLKPPLRHGFNPLSSAPNEPQFLGRSMSNGRSGSLEKRQFASIFHH